MTRYVEPVRSGGPPGPFRSVTDQKFVYLFDQMTPFFEKGYALTDLQGLERMGQVLYQLENHRLSDITSNLSLVVALNKLAEIVKILTNFRPMWREESIMHLEIAQRMNFGRCFQIFFNYIDQMSFRIIDMVEESDVEAGRSNLLLHLKRIVFYIDYLKGHVEDKFNGYPETDYRGYRWNIFTDYSDYVYLPPAVHAIFQDYSKPTGPLPPWLFPQNTSLTKKVLNSRNVQLRTLADAGFVCLCKKKAPTHDSISFFQDCDHLFCSPCLKDYFFENGYDQWVCPLCPLYLDGYASMSGSDDRSVTFNVPPHRQTITMHFKLNDRLPRKL